MLDDAALVAAAFLVAAVPSRGVLSRGVLSRGVLGRGVPGAVLDRGRRVSRQFSGTVGAVHRCRAGDAGQPDGRIPDTLGAAAATVRHREPVFRVRPQASLVWVRAGRLNLRRQRGQLVAAPLTDDREWLPVQHEPERDLIRQARLVKTRDRRDAEQRSIYAA